ncbi:MAG: hypothetical protein KME16_04795 [Scytolyngbya sp. HA4215-MV1]|jgi:hypothetical protein|nr:hypothetical protein [Scytolyngbya sp. HA4215-MV1]
MKPWFNLKRRSLSKVAIWFLIGIVTFSIALILWLRQPDETLSQSPPQLLSTLNGARLEKIPLADGNSIYLQTINLQTMQIEQIVGAIESTQSAQGLYYPSQENVSSPFFERLTPASIRDSHPLSSRNRIFSIINGSFFEDYQPSTRLSFPIKLNGKVITAGSSSYGPIPQSADPAYRTVQLKVLIWGEGQARITNYDPNSGAPLTQPDVQNAIVSYAYRDHPAYRLAGDPVNRYHILGVRAEVGERSPSLVIATADRATLEETAQVLRRSGVEGDLITIDGGISTYLWNAQVGDLILPQVVTGEKVAALPHYLKIRPRAKQS